MKTALHNYIMSLLLCLHLSSTAQNELFKVAAHTGIYAGYGNGGTIGPLFGITAFKKLTSSSALSLTLGYTSLRTKNKPYNGQDIRTRIVPVMMGYRKHWNKFYVEPRAGLGELGGKFDIGGDVAKPSLLAFMYALSTGLSFPKIDIGLDIHGGAIGISSKDAGVWYNSRQYYSGIKIAIPVSTIK